MTQAVVRTRYGWHVGRRELLSRNFSLGGVDMNLGAPELLILLLAAVPYAVIIWGIVDAALRPEWAWRAAGQSRVLWIVLQVIGLFLCLVGFVLSVAYLTAIRSQVARQQGPAAPYPGAPEA